MQLHATGAVLQEKEDLTRKILTKQVQTVPRKDGDYMMPHPVWTESELHNVTQEERKPEGLKDWLARITVQTMRFNFDVLTTYKFQKIPTKATWVNRLIFLETVAGVPGSAASVIRHLHSLRRLQRDHGWIHTLLAEAENERMHLMTFLELKRPGPLFRLAVFLAQGVFFNFYFLAYLASPSFCHRLVGELEQEAVITYTKLIKELDAGHHDDWKTMRPPQIAIDYWRLGENATMRDLLLNIRADEAHHRDCNHLLAGLNEDDDNPIPPGL
eukprot:CAMPEP_0119144178 /NCGR_PEP_ID=MMETSP1310-20130426/35491_1 /TAXON_ID=464262 /ORGANISM="Genus nov. species nov., Strain RCC2339" /LENGTH=270 /DNA_ID=CAMNT_0007135887 /DNA_START=154 /DNA_END=966 /DNA_ORIENTATION=+